MRKRHLPAAVLLGAAVTWLPAAARSLPASQSSQDVKGLEEARARLDKYIETRRLISAERRDWVLGKEMLAGRVDLLAASVADVRQTITETEGSLGDTQTQLETARASKTSLVARTERLATAVGALEERTRALLVRLPEPLREKLRILSQRIPEDPATTSVPLSDRYLNVIGILSATNKAQREVNVSSEVHGLSNGSSAEVEVLYLGIAKAFYVSADKRFAGVGSPGPDGWKWTPANDAAESVRAAIDVFRNQVPATFVRLPMEVE